MSYKLSAYHRHHPVVKYAAADVKPLFTTIKNNVRDFFTPQALTGTAVGGAGGAYLGDKERDKELQQNSMIPPVKALPDYNDRAIIQPIHQQVN